MRSLPKRCEVDVMKNILTIKEQDIIPGSPEVETVNFRERSTARAVFLDKSGQVCLFNVSMDSCVIRPS